MGVGGSGSISGAFFWQPVNIRPVIKTAINRIKLKLRLMIILLVKLSERPSWVQVFVMLIFQLQIRKE